MGILKRSRKETHVLTLQGYKKQLVEKKASSNLLKMSVAKQQKMVDVSEDFKSMKLVGKKKDEQEKTVRKKGSVNEKKVAKSMSFNGFFEPVRRQRSFASNNYNQIQIVKEDKVKADTIFRFEDAKQFPCLGATF